ncbi:hypothetical protein [Maribacter sp. R77961]|uniref:hypothetical protein n=1 Tax=Maribacter sp. R77961 TaxID=3093871 RepID=UPI0037C883CD
MILTDHTSQQLSTGAVALTLFSTILGGHLTASYLLYLPDPDVVAIFMKIVVGVVLLNIIYFLICFSALLTNIPNKPLILKAGLFMGINIPIAIGYLIIVLSYTELIH